MTIKSAEEITLMREAGRRLALVMKACEEMALKKANLLEIDAFAGEEIRKGGDEVLFKGYKGFPANICLSLNNVVVHGIAFDYQLKDGDILGIDMGLRYKGFCADMARTVMIGKVRDEVRKLVEDTKKAFEIGMMMVKDGVCTGDIGFAVQSFCEGRGYGVVRALTGHGIGRELHEDPPIPNYGRKGKGDILLAGMTIALEPMVNLGTGDVKFEGWFCYTADGALSAHFENTLLVTSNGCEILTKFE